MAHQSRPRTLAATSLALAVAATTTLAAAVVAGATVLTAGSAHAASKPPPRIVFQRENPYSGDYRVMLGQPNGKARYLTGKGASSEIPVWSPHGARIAYTRYFLHPFGETSAATDLVIMGARGRNKQVVLPSLGRRFITDIAWAPGGRRLALTMWRDTGGPIATGTDIYIFDLATRQLKPLHLDEPESDIDSVDWSPDGTTLAFSSIDFSDGANEDMDIFTVRPDGTGLETLLGNPNRDESSPAYSPAGTRILFSARGSKCVYPMIARADGTNAQRAQGPCLSWSSTWSPNGKRILISLLNGRRLRNEVWAYAPFGTFHRLVTVGEYASWRPPQR